MMKIKVLGSGCARCHELERITREAVMELGIEASVEEVKDINKIIAYNVLATPGLVINEKVVSSGKLPAKAEVISHITTALKKEGK